MKTISQSIKRQIKNEIATEISQAIEIGATKGTVVTSRGDVIKFEVEYGSLVFVLMFGHAHLPQHAASHAMYNLGYTRS